MSWKEEQEKGFKKLTDEQMKIANGIHGTRYGMHVDNAEIELIRTAG